MSDYERPEGAGALFKNDKTKENQPDYTGMVKVGGVDKRIAAWIKDGRKGKFMSLKISDPLPREGEGQSFDKELDDEIPF